MKLAKQSCKALTAEGSQCEAAAIHGSDFCFFHDPTKAAERKEAHAAGGRQNRMKTLDPETSDIKIKDSRDVIALLSETINQVRKGQLDPRIANSVGFLAGITIRVLEQNQLEDRIEKIEQLLKNRTKVTELTLTGS